VTWRRIAWIGHEPEPGRDFAIMPASVRLAPERLLTVIRHRGGNVENGKKDHTRLTSFLSEDNGHTWKQVADPAPDNVNNPAALIRMPDGRLVLAYVFRNRDADGSGRQAGYQLLLEPRLAKRPAALPVHRRDHLGLGKVMKRRDIN
jgi:hypothetical protein